MPRHPNDPLITKSMLTMRSDKIEAMTPVEFRDLVVPLMNVISTTPFPKRGGPFGILGKWRKKYTQKRIYEVLVVLYRGGKRTDHIVALVTEMLKENYSETAEYKELDMSAAARYGGGRA